MAIPVTPADARQELGLDAAAGREQIRARYRSAIRAVHPDLSGSDHHAAARLNEAFTVLSRTDTDAVSVDTDPTVDAALDVDIDDDRLTLIAPADEVFERLRGSLGQVGTVVSADPVGGSLEADIPMPLSEPSRLHVSLRGRSDVNEASFTLETPPGAIAPPLDRLVERLARLVRTMS